MRDKNILMVDLVGQYDKIKDEINQNIINSLQVGKFINGPIVKEFSQNLSNFLNVKHVIPCANGTDALQIAYMALGLKSGDEIICPSWTYISTAEAAAIIGVKTIFCDVDPNTFNVTAEFIEPLITKKTKAIVVVHLYGQSCDMEPILNLAKKHNLKVIEDNAQAIGCEYTFSNGEKKYTGTIGDIGATSFYPTKNLGAYGDGGAIFTNNDDFAKKIKMYSNHGESKRYHHNIIGINSRLDSIQAEVLNVKLKYLNDYNNARNQMAENYNKAFKSVEQLQIPELNKNSTHVYHQYTLKVLNGKRNDLMKYLDQNGIETRVYYPIPVHKQKAFSKYSNISVINTDELVTSCLSLPIHTEVEKTSQDFIIDTVKSFFK
ncbi:DegT/DnrJ/EryC1/StrS family aminotransferase [Flavobacteriaceae bacterium]|nr:DegT/DnrJ/EryC1/StrS family aminotransferase [Flavobacteriaceae bacterium]